MSNAVVRPGLRLEWLRLLLERRRAGGRFSSRRGLEALWVGGGCIAMALALLPRVVWDSLGAR